MKCAEKRAENEIRASGVRNRWTLKRLERSEAVERFERFKHSTFSIKLAYDFLLQRSDIDNKAVFHVALAFHRIPTDGIGD